MRILIVHFRSPIGFRNGNIQVLWDIYLFIMYLFIIAQWQVAKSPSKKCTVIIKLILLMSES